MTENILVIDAQLLQTAAWGRGMGKYSRSLIRAYAKEKNDSKIIVIFNENLSIDINRQNEMREILPNAEFIQLDLPVMPSNVKEAKHSARITLDNYLKKYDGTTIDFLILNLFTFDYCATFPTNVRKMLLFYDFVPLEYWPDFSKYFGLHLYFAHFSSVYEADTIFSISETTKNQLVKMLGIDPICIINIKGAYIPTVSKIKTAEAPSSGPYILAPTADFPHKNNLNAVLAFTAFNEVFGNSLRLILTSSFSDDSKAQLCAVGENIEFSGNVSDEELAVLYKNADLLLFSSKAEGLGLPILEAVDYKKPVVCSRISVFEEISKDAFYFNDPNDIQSIQQALKRAHIREKWDEKNAMYDSIAKKFTWEASAKIFSDELGKGAPVNHERKNLKKLAIVMPAPDENGTTIGQVNQSAYGFIKEEFHVNYYLSSTERNPRAYPFYLNQFALVNGINMFNKSTKSKYEKILYCVDDSAASLAVLMRAVAMPGVVILDTQHADLLVKDVVDEQVFKCLLEGALTHKSAIKLLEILGNKVVVYDDKHKNGRSFGKKIAEILE